ncbi:MAG TPA: HAMP domain-containing sensor histidine kinase [Candidatus Krumholzibacteria bacterium]|nr:HAMP domain-containing sensor histidine kinase [Candidatus Krumholzibacteria bacterium]
MDEKSFYSTIFDAVRDPLMVVGSDGDVHAANTAAIQFLDVAQEAGLFGRRDDDDEVKSILGNGVLDMVRRRLTVRGHALFARDGRDLGILVDVEPMPGSAALLHFHAPTENLARELWSDDAIAAVAHEIKNPLAAMRSALDVVMQDPSTPLSEPHQRMLGAFDRSTRRLGRLVDGVLNVSRLNSGAAAAPREPLFVSGVIDAVAEEYRCMHPRNCPHIDRDVVDADASAYADRDSLEIVLLNLLGNAARFSREGDVVTLRAARAGVESMEESLRLVPWDLVGKPQLVRIEIEDRGIGMTSDVLEHLFDRYHVGPDPEAATGFAPAQGTAGTHLGLHISRAIAEAHDGWLRVESHLGEGTVASVVLPGNEPTARLVSRLRLASETVRRWHLSGHELVVVAIAKATRESWQDFADRWTSQPRVDPIASTCASRRALLWGLDDDLGVAIIPTSSRDEDPSDVLGAPLIRAGDCAWGMDGFVAGWSAVEDAEDFAAAFRRAGALMSRTCSDIARGAGNAVVLVSPEDESDTVAVLPQMETTLHVENEE